MDDDTLEEIIIAIVACTIASASFVLGFVVGRWG